MLRRVPMFGSLKLRVIADFPNGGVSSSYRGKIRSTTNYSAISYPNKRHSLPALALLIRTLGEAFQF